MLQVMTETLSLFLPSSFFRISQFLFPSCISSFLTSFPLPFPSTFFSFLLMSLHFIFPFLFCSVCSFCSFLLFLFTTSLCSSFFSFSSSLLSPSSLPYDRLLLFLFFFFFFFFSLFIFLLFPSSNFSLPVAFNLYENGILVSQLFSFLHSKDSIIVNTKNLTLLQFFVKLKEMRGKTLKLNSCIVNSIYF
jgi:hypothetical protein